MDMAQEETRHQGWRQDRRLSTESRMRMQGRWEMRGNLGIVGVCDFLRKEPRTGDALSNLRKQHWHSDDSCYAWLMLVQIQRKLLHRIQ